MSGDVTPILKAIDAGNVRAAEELLPLVYEELRQLASQKMASEKPGQTLQATALVHDAWIKLAGSYNQEWQGRSHFFGAVAEAMRRILIDKARRKAAIKRGEGVELEELNESRIEVRAPADEIIAINEALDELAKKEPVSAEVVTLKYFVGMTLQEIADSLEISLRACLKKERGCVADQPQHGVINSNVCNSMPAAAGRGRHSRAPEFSDRL